MKDQINKLVEAIMKDICEHFFGGADVLIREILQKHLQSTTPAEFNDRDCDLADIFNTSESIETKGDLYMRIIEYLVKKGFLQEGKKQAEETVPTGKEEELRVVENPKRKTQCINTKIGNQPLTTGKEDSV